jgi:Cu+-exporting ATPase
VNDFRFDVEGMHCAACVARVEAALRGAPGVRVVDVAVNLTTHGARIRVDAPDAAALAAARDALVRAAAAAGYALVDPASGGGRAARDVRERRGARVRAVLALAGTAPLVVSEMGGPPLPGAPWTGAALACGVVFGCGGPTLLRGWQAARRGAPDMFTLVGLGAVVAVAASLVGLVRPEWVSVPGAHGAHAHGAAPRWFESAAAVVAFVLFGRLLEARARGRAGDAVRALAALRPVSARRRRPGAAEPEDVPWDAVQVGDELVVRPGERVPTDGVVVDGASSVDASLLTGEPLPLRALPGDAVPGGALNFDGAFVLRATAVGGATKLAGVVRAVEEAATTKAPVARLADLVAARFVPFVLALAALTALAWSLFGPEPRAAFAIATATAVLVVACPCALGLATPTALAVAMGRGAARGLFVRHAAALEALARADTLVCDKTGTLTRGAPDVLAVELAPGRDAAELWTLVATAEADSGHPVGRALARRARREGAAPGARTEFVERPGVGVSCLVDGRRVEIGRGDGATVRVAVDGAVVATLTLHDPPRPEAAEVLAAFRALGFRIVMATGDAEAPARAAAAAVGVDDVRAALTPEGKRDLVRELKAGGARVAVLGDGINDAPALSEADVGLAFGGADVASAASDVALAGGDLRQAVDAVRLARATFRVVRQNLAFAFAYNLVMLPAAAGALYPFTGLLFDPMWAGAAMALSSVTVVLNSLRVR